MKLLLFLSILFICGSLKAQIGDTSKFYIKSMPYIDTGYTKKDTLKCLVQVVQGNSINLTKAWVVIEKSWEQEGVVCFLSPDRHNILTNLWKPQRAFISGFRIIYYNEPQYMIYEW